MDSTTLIVDTKDRAEGECPPAVIQLFKMMNKLQYYCTICAIICIFPVVTIPCSLVLAFGACFTRNLNLCVFRTFHVLVCIVYFGILVGCGIWFFYTLYLYPNARPMEELRLFFFMIFAVIAIIVDLILFTYPVRLSIFITKAMKKFDYIPISQLTSWYKSDYWGRNSSIKNAQRILNED